MSDKISIIVPVYNAEKYLPQCIESILGQTYENLEILLVDDGSPDRCGEICDEYAKRDARIRVIHQQNKGVSAARNAALDQAAGAYIGFVDADDWIEPNMYERMYEWIKREQTRMVASGWMVYEEESGSHYCDRNFAPELFCGEEALYRLLKIAYFQGYLWNKLFDACLFHKGGTTLRFDERVHICQDLLFTYQAIDLAGAIFYCSDPLYHYRIHSQSVLRAFSEKALSMLIGRGEIIRLAQQRGGRILELSQGLYSEAAANVRSRAAASGNKQAAKALLPEVEKYAGILLKSGEFSIMTKLVFLLRMTFPSLGYQLVQVYKSRFRLGWKPSDVVTLTKSKTDDSALKSVLENE